VDGRDKPGHDARRTRVASAQDAIVVLGVKGTPLRGRCAPLDPSARR
jgi:hypothetical protein